MKASKAIEMLQAVIKESGDFEVNFTGTIETDVSIPVQIVTQHRITPDRLNELAEFVRGK